MILRLDYTEEKPDSGDFIIRTERKFLEVVAASTDATFYVQGRGLCQWAKDWCDGRDIPTEMLEPPRVIWRRLYPLWTDNDISVLQERTGGVAPATMDDAIAILLPGLLGEDASSNHAAQWLLWLDGENIAETDPVRPLVHMAGEKWRTDNDESHLYVQSAYHVTDTRSAQELLKQWIIDARLGTTFPLLPPQKWLDLARTEWQYEAVHNAPAFWKRITALSLRPELRAVAATIIHAYLVHHPGEITADLLADLRKHLPQSEWRELQRACPPAPPRAIDKNTAPDVVLHWFKNEYLPFRQWQVLWGDAGHAEQIATVAHRFSEWLIDFYPKAIAGGNGYNFLAIAQSANLQAADNVTLWVILDGMPVPDGERLRDLLEEGNRFTIAENHLCFSSLPTITCFCKSALMNGSPPESFSPAETPVPRFASAVVLQDRTMLEQATSARVGQVLVWSHKNPDSIYHRNQSRQTTLSEVEAELQLVANRICQIAFAVPPENHLRVVVSTDHGRLLDGTVPRCHTYEPGATPEGRAAWGVLQDVPPAGVVALDSETFRLPNGITAWVAYDANAFLQANGAAGTVAFPHGGLWPEEVITPWFSFVRDVATPALRVQLMASGRTGGAGLCTITADNVGETPLIITRIRLEGLAGDWVWERNVSISVAAQSHEVSEHDMTPYPSETIVMSEIVGVASTRLASGVTLTVNMDVSVKRDALYQRGLDAQDLMDL